MMNKVEIVKNKNFNDILTENDLKMDSYIVEKIKSKYPKFNFLTEESHNDKDKFLFKDYTFILDPIDGTCNYMRNNKLTGIQFALFLNESCVLSAIYLPYQKEFYHAVLNGGSFKNNKKIKIDSNIKNKHSIIQLSDFSKSANIDISKQFQIVKNLQNQFMKTRLFGAACIDFTNIASNKSQAYISYYKHIWDIAPGLLLIKETGAVYKTLENKNYNYGDKSLVVANNTTNLKIILDEYEKIR